MQLIDVLKEVLLKQGNSFKKQEIDIRLFNGNILLRSFHLYEVDLRACLIKGLTAQEEYSSAREGREPSYAIFKFEEIKELIAAELELEFNAEACLATA
jgi:hypothetical protein